MILAYILGNELKCDFCSMLACHQFSGCHTADNIVQESEDTMHLHNIWWKASHCPNSKTSFKNQMPVTLMRNLTTATCRSHFCHTTQLIDRFKDVGQLKHVLGKTSETVNHAPKSTITSDLTKREPRLQTANATRWNLHVKMICSILAVPGAKLNQLNTLSITPYDHNVSKDLLQKLESFYHATNTGQHHDKAVGINFIIPASDGFQMLLTILKPHYSTHFNTALNQMTRAS